MADPTNDLKASENGTQEDQITALPDSATNAVDTQVTIEDTSETDNQIVKPKETQRNYEAELGKMSALERERNELRAKLQEAESKGQMFDTLNQDFSDPEVYEAWRRARIKKGDNIPSYEEVYGQPQTSGVQQNVSTYQDPNLLVSRAKQEIRSELGFEKFTERHPEFKRENIKTEEELATRRTQWAKIAARAASYIATDPNLTEDRAFEEAMYSLPEYQEERFRKVRETGEIVGRQNAYIAGNGSISGLSGGQAQGGSPTTVRLNKDQWARYEALKKKNPKLAQMYAKNVSGLK